MSQPHEQPGNEEDMFAHLEFDLPPDLQEEALNFDEIDPASFGKPTAETRKDFGAAFGSLPFKGAHVRSASFDYSANGTPVRLNAEDRLSDTPRGTVHGNKFSFEFGEGEDKVEVYPGGYQELEATQRERADRAMDTLTSELFGIEREWVKGAWNNIKTLDPKLTPDIITGLLVKPPHEVREFVQEFADLPGRGTSYVGGNSLIAERTGGNEPYMADLRAAGQHPLRTISVLYNNRGYQYTQHADGSEKLLIGRHTPETAQQAHKQGRDVPTEGTLRKLTTAIEAVTQLYAAPRHEA